MLICFAISFCMAILLFFFPVFMEFPIFRYLSNCGTMQDYTTCSEIEGVHMYMLVMDYWAWKLLVDPVFVASAFMVCIFAAVRIRLLCALLCLSPCNYGPAWLGARVHNLNLSAIYL